MDGGYRGTTYDQDNRFTDKEKKLLKQMNFEPILETKVDFTKINVDVIKPWIVGKLNEILGVDDDIVVEFVFNQLDDKDLNPKLMQINLTGFLNARQAREFMAELWQLFAEAQNCPDGIPVTLVEKKMRELKGQPKSEERNRNFDDSDWKNRYNSLTGGRYGTTDRYGIRHEEDRREHRRDRYDSPRRRRSPPDHRFIERSDRDRLRREEERRAERNRDRRDRERERGGHYRDRYWDRDYDRKRDKNRDREKEVRDRRMREPKRDSGSKSASPPRRRVTDNPEGTSKRRHESREKDHHGRRDCSSSPQKQYTTDLRKRHRNHSSSPHHRDSDDKRTSRYRSPSLNKQRSPANEKTSKHGRSLSHSRHSSDNDKTSNHGRSPMPCKRRSPDHDKSKLDRSLSPHKHRASDDKPSKRYESDLSADEKLVVKPGLRSDEDSEILKKKKEKKRHHNSDSDDESERKKAKKHKNEKKKRIREESKD